MGIKPLPELLNIKNYVHITLVTRVVRGQKHRTPAQVWRLRAGVLIQINLSCHDSFNFRGT